MFRRRVVKNKIGLRIDEVPDEPGRTDTIDLRVAPRNPGFTAVVFDAE
jgi:hypothetical protein